MLKHVTPGISGLVGYWPLASNSLDERHIFNGTDTAIVYDGESAAFNGSTSKIQVATSTFSPFRQATAITYSFWAKFPSSSGGVTHTGTSVYGGHGSGGVSVSQSGSLMFAWTPVDPGSDKFWSAAAGAIDDEWHHYSFTMSFTGATSGKWYMDGVLLTTSLSGAVVDGTPHTGYNYSAGDCIGSRSVNIFNYGNATLAEVCIYNRVLTSKEVAYLAGFSGLKVFIGGVDMTSLVLWRSFLWKPAITNKVDTLSFQMFKYGTRTYTPSLFDEIEFYDNGVLVFSGPIIQHVESVDAVERQLYSITCKDHTQTLDRRLVIERYTEKPIINIVCDILNRYVNKGSRLEIATFETNEIWIGGTVDTTNYRIADQALKITSTNAVAANAYRDILINLEPSGYSSSDFIECDVYVDDVTKLGSSSMVLGDATLTNYFTADISSQLTSTGWNFVQVAKSSFVTIGSIAWANIARIKLVVTSTASNTVNVTFDNWQEVKTTAFTRNGTNSTTQTIRYIACNYEEPSKIFQRMADMYKMQWYVTADKDIKFFSRFDDPAPFALSDTLGNHVYNSLVVNSSADQIRNGIFVRGADYLSTSRTDNLKQQADSINKIFVLGFKYANYSLAIDGVTQAIGLENINGYTDNNGVSQLLTGGTALVLGDAAARTRQAQQVLVTSSGKRTNVLLRVRKVGAPVDDLQVQIFSNSSNTPTATALSTIATRSGSVLTTSFVEYSFSLSPTAAGDLTLLDGATYHIVCSRSGANDAANYYEIDAVPRGNYDGVPNVYSGSWAVGTSVMYFSEKIAFDVLYSFNEKILTFATAPAAASDILFTGQPYLPINVRYSDATSVSQFGEYEFRILDKSIKTQEGARQRANAELLSFAQSIQDVKFITYQAGLSVGQTINIQSTIRNLNLNLIIMGISAKAKSPTSMEYSVTCALTKTMGIIYWLQDQIAKDSRSIVIDDNELFDRVDSLSETVYLGAAYASDIFIGHVWSNDAGSTSDALIWSGGSTHIWI